VLYDEKLLGKFCGNENSADGHHPGYQPILSPGSRLTLLFQSDDYNPDRHQNVTRTPRLMLCPVSISFLWSLASLSLLTSLTSSTSRVWTPRKAYGLMNTNSNTVRLDYHIDDQGQSHGWSLDYSTHSEGVKE
ncbi:hypothetical protein GOODEAATRI_010203, partial [Goodea atripinnis]